MVEKRIVIMGGSFNPPTIAHYRLMKTAMDTIGADRGVFVPTATQYVFKKLKRQGCPGDTLSSDLRVEMLNSLCRRDERLEVSTWQIDREKETGTVGKDFYVLEAMQEKYPDAKIFFVVGSDKLYALPSWHRATDFVEKFKILVALRGEDDPEVIKTAQPFVAEHWDSFEVFPIPNEIKDISSGSFRERLRNGDTTARELVTEEVWRILNENGRVPWNSIVDFHDPQYSFLSNFYEAPVTYRGLTFGSNEAAFQAQKCTDEEAKRQFTEYSPGKSKGIGRRVSLRPDWEEVKDNIMYEIVLAKFTQHPELAEKLLATGEKILVEGNTWHDVYWGVDIRKGEGENRLGRILMRVRTELAKQSKSIRF